MANFNNLTLNTTDFTRLPLGTTLQRPSSPVTGMIRYNTNINVVELYNGTSWQALDGKPRAAGGTITTVGEYTIHTFTGSGNFEVICAGTVEYLIVAGGGGGNHNQYDDGAGGGAGGLLQGSVTVTPQTYAITVGGGGAIGSFGGDSIALGLTSKGGGPGGSHRSTAPNGGGSGGGAGGAYGTGDGGDGTTRGGDAVLGQGNPGGFNVYYTYPGGAGGGGAGMRGGRSNEILVGGYGGIGLKSAISGTPKYYAGGGAGYPSGLGGLGGGGGAYTPGEANTGGGGGGGKTTTYTARPGGSGIVIIRYLKP
jgi:hypothetical protein